jgi:hypothetical protein
MTGTCENCEVALEADWVACPHCGRPVSGNAGTEKLVRIVTRVGIDLLEAGLLQAEAGAEEEGNKPKAAQIALARNLAKDIAPKIADAVTTYLYQKQRLSVESSADFPPPKKHGGGTALPRPHNGSAKALPSPVDKAPQ